MKIVKLFNDYKPHLKCGAELPIGEFVTVGGSFLNGIVSGVSSSSNVEKQLGAQRVENQLNRDWQTAEAEKARAFSAQQLSQQNQFQQVLQAQQQQYNLQSMARQAYYNSPVYQRQQLEMAGINPQVYFGNQSSFSGSSASSGGSPSAPGVGSSPSVGSVGGLSPVSYQPPLLNLANLISAVGSYQANSAKSQEIKSLLESRLAGLDLDNEAKVIANKMANVELFVQRNIKDARVKKALNEVQNVAADTYLKLSSGDEKVSMSALNYSQMELNNILANKTGQEYELLKLELANWYTKFNAYIDNLRAQTGNYQASARQSTASAESQEFFNKLQREDGVKDSLVKQLRLAGEAAERANDMTKEQANMLRAQVEQLEKATSNYEIQMWSNIINQTINTASNAVGQFTRFALVKEFMNKGKPAFDANAGNSYYMDQSNGLIFPK